MTPSFSLKATTTIYGMLLPGTTTGCTRSVLTAIGSANTMTKKNACSKPRRSSTQRKVIRTMPPEAEESYEAALQRLKDDPELCIKSPKGEVVHCNHWYDGDACHWCDAPAMTDAEKKAQGMEE